MNETNDFHLSTSGNGDGVIESTTSQNVTSRISPTRVPVYVIESQISEQLVLAGSYFYSIVGITALLANLFVIIVILIWERNRSNRSVTQLFAMNLAVADLLFVFITPLYFVQNWHTFWGGLPMCFANKVFHVICLHASIIFLTVMSLDRLLATVFLMRMRIYRTRKNAIIACVVVWLVAIATSAPWMTTVDIIRFRGGASQCSHEWPKSNHVLHDEIDNYFYGTDEDKDKLYEELKIGPYEDYDYYGIDSNETAGNETEEREESLLWWENPEYVAKLTTYDNTTGNNTEEQQDYQHDDDYVVSCYTPNEHSPMYKTTTKMRFIFLFICPVVIIAGSYLAILFKATKSLNRMQSAQRNMRKHMVVTILAMVAAFITCWTPTLVFNMFKIYTDVKMHVKTCFWIQEAFDWLAYSTCAINPILYWLASRSFQQKIRAVHEYLTTGRNLRSLVIRVREESTNRTSILRMQPAAKNTAGTNSNRNEDTMPLRPLNNNQKPDDEKDESLKNSAKKSKEKDVDGQKAALLGSKENDDIV